MVFLLKKLYFCCLPSMIFFSILWTFLRYWLFLIFDQVKSWWWKSVITTQTSFNIMPFICLLKNIFLFLILQYFLCIVIMLLFLCFLLYMRVTIQFSLLNNMEDTFTFRLLMCWFNASILWIKLRSNICKYSI